MAASPLLSLAGISKSYAGVRALVDVSLGIEAGTVLGLIGENGAGKSTLMKILGGVVQPSAGSIVIDGVGHSTMTVASAARAGIAFVHQELTVLDNLDVAANIFLGREPVTGGPLRLVRNRTMHDLARPLLRRLGADFGPETSVSKLLIAQRQLVEIARALSVDARVIIMDEPTSSLTLQETERLLAVIAELRSSGVSVIYISHRLHEVKACADRVVCLRDGRVAGALDRDGIEHNAMIRLMIGRELRALYTPPRAPPGGEICVVDRVVTGAFPDRHVSLDVQRGEILGIAGLVGSGRTSLARALFGVDPILSGEVRLSGEKVAVRSPRQAIAQGIYLVPEDRKGEGLVLDMALSENISLASLRRYAHFNLIDREAEAVTARAQQAALRIKTPSVAVHAATLSGGNQQKVVLAKWLSMAPRLMIFDEPTRGIDVGAKGEIYALMRALADQGVGVIMISSDMEEVIGVSDRVAVMHEGEISGVLDRADFSELNVLRLAIGQPAEHLETV
ncbi:sugar ABC transporter ATP-binding protein [Lichenicoccus sp.]|uniref:sugar ABC transporter ATP-binding protein n=1 Tax=Lichenicoccus sp. TaxID=2781899 RepID=UPI003D0A038A